MAATCNFVSLRNKMRELLVKNWKREKEKIIDHTIGLKKARNFRAVLQRSLAKLNES